MTAWTDLIPIGIGWLLGFLSFFGTEKLRRRMLRKEVKVGILSELREAAIRAGLSASLIYRDLGMLNRELLEWDQEVCSLDSDGLYVGEKVIEARKKLLELNDDQLSELAREVRSRRTSDALSTKKINLPFLQSKLGDLALLDIKFQARIHQIRAQVDILNEEIELGRFYFQKTFELRSDPDNLAVIKNNYDANLKNTANKSRHVANLILALIHEEDPKKMHMKSGPDVFSEKTKSDIPESPLVP